MFHKSWIFSNSKTGETINIWTELIFVEIFNIAVFEPVTFFKILKT